MARRAVRVHPVFYARLNLTGTPELRSRFLAAYLPGIVEDLAADFEGQLPAPDRPGVRIVVGAGDGMLYAVTASLDEETDVVIIRSVEIEDLDATE